METMSVKHLLQNVTKWAEQKAEIIGLAIVGSHARNEARPDSDVDLILLAAHPERFIDDLIWIEQFGQVTSQTIEDWGLVQSIRVFYTNGPEVEYGMTSAEWATKPIDEGTREVIDGGMRVLVDKTGLLMRALKEK